jgi:hypothetical protein
MYQNVGFKRPTIEEPGERLLQLVLVFWVVSDDGHGGPARDVVYVLYIYKSLTLILYKVQFIDMSSVQYSYYMLYR